MLRKGDMGHGASLLCFPNFYSGLGRNDVNGTIDGSICKGSSYEANTFNALLLKSTTITTDEIYVFEGQYPTFRYVFMGEC